MNQQNYDKIHKPIKYRPYERNLVSTAKWFKMPRIYKGSYSRFVK